MRWRRKRVDLAERLRPYVDMEPRMEPMVDADPIRMFLFRWMIETGDPIEIVARRFHLDSQLLSDILSRSVRHLPAEVARSIADRTDLPVYLLGTIRPEPMGCWSIPDTRGPAL